MGLSREIVIHERTRGIPEIGSARSGRCSDLHCVAANRILSIRFERSTTGSIAYPTRISTPGYEWAGCLLAHTDVDPHIHTDADLHPYPYTDLNEHIHANLYAHINADLHAHPYPYTDPDEHIHANLYAHINADLHAHPYPYTDPDEYIHADPYTYHRYLLPAFLRHRQR
jgi:hypothetical protein